MLQTKMKGNLSEWEEQYIIHSLSELKLNFIEEQKKGDEDINKSQSEEQSESSKEDKPKPKPQKSKSAKSKTTKKKTK